MVWQLWTVIKSPHDIPSPTTSSLCDPAQGQVPSLRYAGFICRVRGRIHMIHWRLCLSWFPKCGQHWNEWLTISNRRLTFQKEESRLENDLIRRGREKSFSRGWCFAESQNVCDILHSVFWWQGSTVDVRQDEQQVISGGVWNRKIYFKRRLIKLEEVPTLN